MSEPTGPPVPPATPERPAGGAGAVTTSERPAGGAPPPPPTGEEHREDAEIRVETVPAPEPPTPDEDPTVELAIVLDEQDTIELAVADLQAAARAAGVEIAAPPGTPGAPAPDDAITGSAITGDATTTEDGPFDPMDPRIRERRIAVTRAEGRRRLRVLSVAVAVLSVIGIGWLVVQSPLLAVDHVAVRGTEHETPDAVRAAAGIDQGAAMVFVDTGAAARRIEQLPWVARATVSREFPNDVRIAVVERTPVAWVRRATAPGTPKDSGPVALVDASGRALGDSPGPPTGLPELTGSLGLGSTGTRMARADFARAVGRLPDGLRAQVASLGERRGLAVLTLAPLAGGKAPAAREVRLGSLDEVTAKGAAALAVLDQLTMDKARVTYIDVRVPSAPATR